MKKWIGILIIILGVLPAVLTHQLTIMAYNINYTNIGNIEVHTRLTDGPPTEMIMPELEQQGNNFQMEVDGKPCLPLPRQGTIFFFSCPRGSELVVTDTMNYSLMNQTLIVSSTLFFTTFQGKIGEIVDGTQRNVFALPPELAAPQLSSLEENLSLIQKNKPQKPLKDYIPRIAGLIAALVFIGIMIYFFRRSRREKNNG